MKAIVYTTETDEARAEAISAAQATFQEKKTVVIPTDTVYGVAADAFSPDAVSALLAAKGRSRQMPPPVLIFDEAVLPGLADQVSDDATALARKFWPGALTLIMYCQPSLNWDLGETRGTVALRVPDDQLAIDLLRQVGPLAVSSANRSGQTAATDAEEAAEQLGEAVDMIIDDGRRPRDRAEGVASADVLPSTIVDCTSERLVVVREGAISIEQLREVVPSIVTKAELEQDNESAAVRTIDSTTGDRAISGSVRAEDDPRNSGLYTVPGVDAPAPEHGVGRGDAGQQSAQDERPGRHFAEAPRAQAPAEGSFNAGLVGSDGATAGAPVAGTVDQLRTKQAYRQENQRTTAGERTKPLPVGQAHALVFSHADEEQHSEPRVDHGNQERGENDSAVDEPPVSLSESAE
ncbi:L-threonylcarbamoyladenylate synthase [Rothia sp. LK2588]|uniref:L-threonylcarbamoyladenylate synthase n=1 Tax=Rothia sp. LK2588 TaxID=3114369 RepID=UPI0034D01BE2